MGELVFHDAPVGAAYGVAMYATITAVVLFFVLRPWPPPWWRRVFAVAVFALACVITYLAARSRHVVIDLAAGRVTQETRFAGLGRRESWPLGDFAAVVAEHTDETYRTHPPSGSGDDRMNKMKEETVSYFVISLERAAAAPGGGGPAAVQLVKTEHWDALTAEAEALRVADATGLPARRRGYEFRVTDQGVRVTTRAGAESTIEKIEKPEAGNVP